MGFFLEDKTLFPAPTKITTPLYLGLTTGYCGSVTTFSSFILGAFEQLDITAPVHPGRRVRDNVAAMLAYAIGTIAISLGGLQVGTHLAVLSSKGLLRKLHLRWMDTLVVPIGLGIWVASVIMAVFIRKWRGDVLFACVFSPPGAIARFWASRLGNPIRKSFPLGTFVVNMLGTAVLAGLLAGRYVHSGGDTCDVLRGLGDGFCGCLTTVSTFAVELRNLRIDHGYIYAGTSIVVGLCLVVLILGSYTWVHGAGKLAC